MIEYVPPKWVDVIFLKELKMLVLSILFFTVAILLVYSLTKDTGANTMHARSKRAHQVTKVEHQQEEPSTLSSTKALKAGWKSEVSVGEVYLPGDWFHCESFPLSHLSQTALQTKN